MINRDIYYRIHYLYKHEALSIDQISEELSLSRSTVQRRLKQDIFKERKDRSCNNKLAKLEGYIDELLKKHPYSVMQIFQMLSEDGFEGSYSTVKRYVLKVRPVQRKAYFKLNFCPAKPRRLTLAIAEKFHAKTPSVACRFLSWCCVIHVIFLLNLFPASVRNISYPGIATQSVILTVFPPASLLITANAPCSKIVVMKMWFLIRCIWILPLNTDLILMRVIREVLMKKESSKML